MFIGDSIQRGQFESMVCMVQSVIPEGKKSFQTIPTMEIFKAEVPLPIFALKRFLFYPIVKDELFPDLFSGI